MILFRSFPFAIINHPRITAQRAGKYRAQDGRS
jgi:hypothetical protein